MTGMRQVVLCVSPELYGRMETRAVAERFDLHEWVLRTVIGELLKPEAERATELLARETISAMTFPPAPRPATERNRVHVPHP